ncbi:hypothetical protein [Paractinoplanes rishiriensis]|uniref:Uncharacterized protein n=1 Tax=Paractinoplanes rishiriensis TaxID=1050105 RepID=A0A919K7E9_9ACTN|nr:hypothetical protein [Actinoplanes rishiriensis]GIF02347.1 hypothetical protein Ari01nite_98110 [Actinoplanes rishiriensis]
MQPPSDSYEALAARCERGADELDRLADNAAEVLSQRAGQADPQQWAADKRAAAATAREYAAGLRAEAGEHPNARPTPQRLAQAQQVATAANVDGILIDGSHLEGADPGKHQAVTDSGVFTHVAEPGQVPFWKLGTPADQNTAQQHTEHQHPEPAPAAGPDPSPPARADRAEDSDEF